jgi:hypothetical protein
MFATPAPKMRAVSAAADLALLSTGVPAALLGVDEEDDAMVSILPEFLARAPVRYSGTTSTKKLAANSRVQLYRDNRPNGHPRVQVAHRTPGQFSPRTATNRK